MARRRRLDPGLAGWMLVVMEMRPNEAAVVFPQDGLIAPSEPLRARNGLSGASISSDRAVSG